MPQPHEVGKLFVFCYFVIISEKNPLSPECQHLFWEPTIVADRLKCSFDIISSGVLKVFYLGIIIWYWYHL